MVGGSNRSLITVKMGPEPGTEEVSMSGNNQHKIYRDLKLEDTIKLEFKVSDMLCAIAEYTNSAWSGPATTKIMTIMQREIMDPIYLNEQEAAMQLEIDQRQAFFDRIQGRNPDIPPNMEQQ